MNRGAFLSWTGNMHRAGTFPSQEAESEKVSQAVWVGNKRVIFIFPSLPPKPCLYGAGNSATPSIRKGKKTKPKPHPQPNQNQHTN